MILYVWLVPLLLWLFLLGAAVGSFLNVCIYRTAAGKSLTWPGSRCGHCFHEVRLKDNIPLVSYWVLRGRCRDCGARFSLRYFWIELLTAVSFVGLYLLEIGLNVQQLPLWRPNGFAFFEWAQSPPHSWELFVFHTTLVCFLLTATGCLLDRGALPSSVLVAGTLVGLLGAILFPWPYPEAAGRAASTPYAALDPLSPRPGFYAWPVWEPLPEFLPPGSRRLGLVTGLTGALVGGWSLRLVGSVLRRVSGRDLVAGAAGLSTIAGAFLGWQPVLVAILLALVGAAVLYPLRRSLPFGLILTLAILAVWLGWARVGALVRPILFSTTLLPLLIVTTLARVERGFV